MVKKPLLKKEQNKYFLWSMFLRENVCFHIVSKAEETGKKRVVFIDLLFLPTETAVLR